VAAVGEVYLCPCEEWDLFALGIVRGLVDGGVNMQWFGMPGAEEGDGKDPYTHSYSSMLPASTRYTKPHNLPDKNNC
jgi:hypothetical protein